MAKKSFRSVEFDVEVLRSTTVDGEQIYQQGLNLVTPLVEARKSRDTRQDVE